MSLKFLNVRVLTQEAKTYKSSSKILPYATEVPHLFLGLQPCRQLYSVRNSL